MKKTLIALLLALPVLFCSCKANNTNADVTDASALSQSQPTATKALPETTAEPDEVKIVGPAVPVGLYVGGAAEGGESYMLVSNFRKVWQAKQDIASFGIMISSKMTLSGTDYKSIWNTAQKKQPDSDSMKTGLTLSFKLQGGELVKKTILEPDDITEDFTNYVEVYIYDDIHQPDGASYSHLLQSQMTDETIITTVKLTGGTDIKKVSEMQLTAFLYEGDGDFDENGTYTGSSSYTIDILNG